MMRWCLGIAIAIALFLVAGAGPSRAQSFVLTAVEFSESQYLSEDQLQAVAAEFVGTRVDFADLVRLQREVDRLYAEAGVVTARAVLPPQDIRGGRLRVELLEARVSEVVVEGLPTTAPDFIRQQIVVEEGALPDFGALEEDLLRFELAHDFKPTLAFKPGAEPGEAIAVIRGEEPKKFEFTLSLDNFGSEATGLERVSAFAKFNSVSGVRDTLFAQAHATEGAWSYGAGYSRPVGGRGGRVSVAATVANSTVIAGPFSAVDIISDSRSASLGYSQPFMVAAHSNWRWRAEYVAEQNDSVLSETEFSQVTLDEVALQATYSAYFEKETFSASLGMRFGNSDAKDTSDTEGRYVAAFGQVNYARALARQLVLSVGADYQFAPNQNLPVARLFNAGGATSVRGYPNAVRSGDSGIVARVQLGTKQEFDLGESGGVHLSPFAFSDLGVIVPFRVEGGIDPSQDYLASLGGGARITFSKATSAVAMVGLPLRDTLGFEDAGEPAFYLGTDINF